MGIHQLRDMRGVLVHMGVILSCLVFGQDSWKDVISTGEGEAHFYWYPNNSTIEKSKDVVDGIEQDIIQSFIEYTNSYYNVTINPKWVDNNDFTEILNIITKGKGGIFGASSISITEERMERMNFTPSFLTDIIVLISHPDLPIAYTQDEFKQSFNGKIAVSIKNTTYDSELIKLRDELGMDLKIKYVKDGGQIIETVEATPNSFAYADLPNYLVAKEHGAVAKRQFFHPVKLKGLAFAYPKGSDWEEPVSNYFNSEQYTTDRSRVFNKYLGDEVETINQVAMSAEIGPYEEILLSNREKELQYQELLLAEQRDMKRKQINSILLLNVVIIGAVLLILFIRFRLKTKANKMLLEKQHMIEQHNNELQALNQEKNDLIKILAHDLRSPLSTIAGISMIFKNHKHLTQDDHKMNDYIATASKKMTDMISKILDVDAIETGKRNVKLELIHLDSIIEKLVKDYKTRASQKNITLEVDNKESLSVIADEIYASQIVENLLSNAIKFSNRDSKVKITTSKNGKFSTVAVQDEGPGFSPEDEKKIFKKYQRLSAKPTAGEESVGLGLTIVKEYTEMMGGKISYQTKHGKGTTFYVKLPKIEA